MNVTFTLTAATSGTTAAGPFNISGTTSGNTTSQLATGITKNQLTTGYTINSVNDAITGGTIASTGSCNTTTTWSVSQLPSGYYYNVQQLSFSCGGGIGTCTGPIGSNKIGYSTKSLIVGDFYNSSGDVYTITVTTTPKTYDMDISTWYGSNYANCGDAANC
jgi:hypothetical protein